jgi:hypothetical protein
VSDVEVFMLSKPCILVKSTLGGNAVACCEGKLIVLCETEICIVLYFVTSMNKFDFRLLTYRTPNTWRPVEKQQMYNF